MSRPDEHNPQETRRLTLAACRAALQQRFGHFHEVRDQLFIVGSAVLRPKGTSTQDEDWVWAGGMPDEREDFYILYDIGDPGVFYIVPSDFVRGALEGGHHQWHRDGDYPSANGSKENTRRLDSDMRRLRKWPIRSYRDAWHLIAAKNGQAAA